ncbi:MAG: peptidoglycan DD-metalloendopeptidase family protein [Bacteroidales bacterium]|jgi:murein DD-endopeptidase MepM/ murein hydrolase activator NlpD|nr:peptidoglycan DD-metalloendopeptidase family protein [Bacteroidales bacterium]
MIKQIVIKLISFCFLLLPIIVFAQLPQEKDLHERGMMQNRKNVGIEHQDSQIGIIKDTIRFHKSLMQFYEPTVVYDQGAESEEEILNEIDLSQPLITSIHRKKTDFSSLEGSIELPLVDEKKHHFVFPLENSKGITSRFGPRRRRFHYGTDLGLRTGEPIKAIFDGRVRYAKRAGAYGNLIVIEHNNQLETYYGHLSRLGVTPGDEVKAGDIIGYGGSTGRSSGPHLHLEIRYQGSAINPEDVINFASEELKDNTLTLTRDNFRHQSVKKNNNYQIAKSKTKANKNGRTYIVKRGETLSGISQRTGVSVKKLAKLNNIKGNKIKAGQKLKLK